MDVDTFRSTWPEFGAAEAYPDPQVSMWLGVAATRLPADRWADLHDLGVGLYVAHNLALGRASTKAAAFGGTPGQNSGPLAQKGADKLSAAYDTAAASIEGAGNYNLTTYGTRFMELVRLVGIGGAYINAGDPSAIPGLSSGIAQFSQ